MSEDDPVIQTNDEASNCKKAAVDRGYWNDPYIHFFVKNVEHKPPEINRGYFARVRAILMLVEKFLEVAGPECQIINMGSGFDTLFWRLKDRKAKFRRFIEMDLPQVTNRKCYQIRLRKQLLKAMVSEGEMQELHLPMGTRSPSIKGAERIDDEEVHMSSCDLHTQLYHLIGVDLRLPKTIEGKLAECSIDYKLPTIFLTECVLVYMPVKDSDALIQWISNKFEHIIFANYDPVNMSDRFAQIMQENLAQRHCLLTGVDACKDLKTQEDRFKRAGFATAKAYPMATVYQSLPPDEIEKIQRIEMLDEHELLQQLLAHYCITIATKGSTPTLLLDKIQFTPDPKIRV